MKQPKSEPYKRSRQRSAMHAWIALATTVAAIGMPSTLSARERREEVSSQQPLHDSVDLDSMEDLKRMLE